MKWRQTRLRKKAKGLKHVLASKTVCRSFIFLHNKTIHVLKNMPGHGGIRIYDIWNTSPMLCQLSYAVRVTSHKHLIHLRTLHQHSKYNSRTVAND